MKAVRRCDKRMTTELDISALYDAVHEAESRNSKCTVVGRNNYSGYKTPATASFFKPVNNKSQRLKQKRPHVETTMTTKKLLYFWTTSCLPLSALAICITIPP